jgi:NAD(P)-dependent dehydrogenase (short-subunit alcohol dehydrogenase family)
MCFRLRVETNTKIVAY